MAPPCPPRCPRCAGTEVVQPNVVDPPSFLAWRDEAFELWTAEWGACYEEGSASRALLKDIANTWCVRAKRRISPVGFPSQITCLACCQWHAHT